MGSTNEQAKRQQLRTGDKISKIQHEKGDIRVCNNHKLITILDKIETNHKDISNQQ